MDILSNAIVGRFFEANSRDPHGLMRAYEEGVCARIFEKLWTDYPGYDWRVKISDGLVTIQLPTLMAQTLGYNFKVELLAGDPNLTFVNRAGGEILERWNLRRGKANKGELGDARKAARFGSYDEVPGGGLKGETSYDREVRRAKQEAARQQALLTSIRSDAAFAA